MATRYFDSENFYQMKDVLHIHEQ